MTQVAHPPQTPKGRIRIIQGFKRKRRPLMTYDELVSKTILEIERVSKELGIPGTDISARVLLRRFAGTDDVGARILTASYRKVLTARMKSMQAVAKERFTGTLAQAVWDRFADWSDYAEDALEILGELLGCGARELRRRIGSSRPEENRSASQPNHAGTVRLAR